MPHQEQRCPMRLGAHVSISGSLDLAIDRAVAIGCECVQIFYGSPRQWRIVTYPEEQITRFRAKRRGAGLYPVVGHASYLVNLAAPQAALRHRSIESLVATTRGIERLDGLGTITHIGSRMGAPLGAALKRAAASVRAVLDRTERAMVLLEGSAGGGGTIGATFDEVGAIIDLLHGDRRVGVCLDTAHLHGAGWDLRSPAGVDGMVAAAKLSFEWRRVRVVHLNDSAALLGSHLDRHDNVGAGHIGLDGFRPVVTHRAIRNLAGIIETPGFDHQGPDRRNLARLRRLQSPLSPSRRRAR
jgi:deoxyribonuclease IV